MSAPAALYGFAFGEHLDSLSGRSLGFRLLAPVEPEAWCPQVEALARLLQTAPYPDHWPQTDLFCSVLLDDGSRLIAVARYGLADQTPGQRRGGLELFGVVGPGSLDPATALAIYHWLRQRRAGAQDLRELGGRRSLEEVSAAATPAAAITYPAAVLPIRLWQDGIVLLAATTPSEPDQRLSLLGPDAPPTWQWLPLVGPDFPFADYARRGPLIASTLHLAGVAVKLERPAERVRTRPSRHMAGLLTGIASVVCLLLAGNLWALLALHARLAPAAPGQADPTPRQRPVSPPAANDADRSREEFARALHRLLVKGDEAGEFRTAEDRFLNRYQSLLQQDKGLQVDSKEGKVAVAVMTVLARRRIDRIVALVREALPSKKGFDAELVEVACRRVREMLATGLKEPTR